MQIGAIIERGPVDWQIIQQFGGSTDISISGRWVEFDPPVPSKIYARIVLEDTGESVVPWTECEYMENYNWRTTFKYVPAGGLYRIETCLSNQGSNWDEERGVRGDMIHHLGVGDIYIIAGQSNSAGYGKDPVYDPPELGVHVLKNNGKWDLASHPLNESTGTIHEENREFANPGHSPYLSFAKNLKRELGYPVGLVQSALGGSPLSRWNPDEEGSLYRSMMKSVISQTHTVKGVLWYQGCSDTGENECCTYLERFGNMVRHLRKDLNNDSLPVLTVQLNRLIAPSTETSDRGWGRIREAQRQAAVKIPGIYIIPAIDCTLSDIIHISSASNMVLGERLARIALSEIYGKRKYLCKAPDLANARREENNGVLLFFDNIYNRYYIIDTDVRGLPFTIEDEKGKVEITGFEVKSRNCLLLIPERELEGNAVIHGAYEQNPKFIIPMDAESHLPMLSFYGIEIE